MDSFATNKDILFEKIENYANTSIDLIKLNAIEKSADVFSSLTQLIVMFSVVAMFTLFVNIGISLYIGKILGVTYLGFIIVSAFYLLLAVLIYCFRKQFIKIPISNMIITKLLNKINLDKVLDTNN